MVDRNGRTGVPRIRCTSWAAPLLALLVAGCQAASPPGPDCGAECRAEFIFPESGEEVLSAGPAQGFEVALGRGDMSDDVGDLAGATVEYSSNAGESWRPAKVEALGQPSGLPHDPVLLRARSVPDGKLLIRASLTTTGGVLYQAQARPVTVWFTPKPKGKVTTATPTDQGRKIRVKFDGSGSTDGKNQPGGVRGWEWDFGDGSPKKTGKDVTHTYQRRGKFMVTLCVTDAKGNRSYKYYKVDTGDDPRDTPPPTIFGEELPEWPDCRCTKMTIDHRQGAAFGGGYTNKWGKKGFTNEFGDSTNRSPAINYGFEVIADIVGNPDKCYEWQEIKRTSQLGGTLSYARGPRIRDSKEDRDRMRARIKSSVKGTFPWNGLWYAVDGYDTTGRSKLHLPKIIRWRDTPGMAAGISGGVPALRRIGIPGYHYKAAFLTFVGGPVRTTHRRGECTCSFVVDIGVDPNGNTTYNTLRPRTEPLRQRCAFLR